MVTAGKVHSIRIATISGTVSLESVSVGLGAMNPTSVVRGAADLKRTMRGFQFSGNPAAEVYSLDGRLLSITFGRSNPSAHIAGTQVLIVKKSGGAPARRMIVESARLH